LSKFSLEQNLIHPSQIWFQSGNRTADHIFSLKTLIDKHIKQNKNDKIYVCFLDFKKAFDSVWDESLLFKLLENKIYGQFYNLFKSLYSNSKFAVKQSKTRTDYFSYSKGVRQECILSHLLFNIYINELATLFDNTSADPFIINIQMEQN
jgi:hypothetical protein